MEAFDLDTTLINFSGNQSAHSRWTLRNAVEGVQIFGGIGSGKTSGSGRMLAVKYLSAGFGGLVLTVKPDEKELWEKYCRLAGREQDLMIIEPGCPHYFNFLDYESRGDGMTENIVEVLKTVIRASDEKGGGKGDDPFWENALDMLIFNVIDLCKLAYGKVSVRRMYDIVQSIPKPDNVSDEQVSAYEHAFEEAKKNVLKQVDEWENGLSVENLQRLTSEREHDEATCEAISDARTLKLVDEFFGETYFNLSEKTRSIIDFSFSGFLYRLLRDPVYTLFCSRASTFTPEVCLDGKIILINLPVKLHQKIGRDSQIMFKYIWQRAMERRDIKVNERPLFLWADEAQNFLHEHDADYQATARSSRIATVYISQNLPNYHANMGGAKSKFKVESFLGTLATKIFHANADVETNRYASELIGDEYYEETSRSATAAGNFSSSRTRSLKIDRAVRPEAFVRLKTGSPTNNFKVEAFLHIQGDAFKDNQNFSKVSFDQNYSPTKNQQT
ncbi:type IV secretory system conjugative DNA transfer family protein [Flavobacterium sp.]|uniref:type IV secretory system conjugative DNA transfer family protein n=1 Tax=Flavobacterium sp. TaxID=239 RepID=UPI0039E4AD83